MSSIVFKPPSKQKQEITLPTADVLFHRFIADPLTSDPPDPLNPLNQQFILINVFR